jgi:hypothetical protein
VARRDKLSPTEKAAAEPGSKQLSEEQAKIQAETQGQNQKKMTGMTEKDKADQLGLCQDFKGHRHQRGTKGARLEEADSFFVRLPQAVHDVLETVVEELSGARAVL